MRSRLIAAGLLLASCLVSPCFADVETADKTADARPSLTEPLSRDRATQILASTDVIAEALTRQIKSHSNRYVDDVRNVMSHSSEWEWYSRDRGILLAIPVKERLGLFTSYDGEKVLADVVRRLINQKGWGNPPVQVVFIEPQLPPPAVGSFARWNAYPPAQCDCGCP